MIRIGTIAIALSVFLSSCNGQTNLEKDKVKNDTIKPETKINVNKEYDDEGNLVRYDSTYSAYYSNIENDSIKADSVFNAFRDIFNKSYGFSNKFFFNNLFFEDSLLHYDFYKKDFFTNRFRNNMSKMNQLFLEMDSVKNDYYEQQLSEEKSTDKNK